MPALSKAVRRRHLFSAVKPSPENTVFYLAGPDFVGFVLDANADAVR
jgi:hypothetical protein